MARKVITAQEVFNVAIEIAERGETPTTLSIHKTLKRGSYSTIQKHLKEWEESDQARDAHIETLPAVIELPDVLETDAINYGKKIWKVANDLAGAKLEQERETLNQLRLNLQRTTQEAVDYADESSERAEVAEEALAAANTANEDQLVVNKKLIDESERLTKELGLTKGERDVLIGQVNALASAITTLETQAKLDAQAVNNEKAALVKAEKAHVAAIDKSDKLHDRAIEGLVKSHDKTVETLTHAHEKAVEQYKEQIKSLNNDKLTLSTEHSAAVKSLVSDKEKLTGELKVVKDELNKLQKVRAKNDITVE